MLSPHPADPTLTTDNLMEVVKGVEDHWHDLSFVLSMPWFKINQIKWLYYSDRRRMQAVADHYTTHDPTRSWNNVAEALQVMELHKQADEVTTKYVKGKSCDIFGIDSSS